jgi:hypothetical protein
MIKTINVNPNTTHHFFYPVLSFIMNESIREKTNPKVAPQVINIWWQLVNVPDISFGASSFIINGAIELSNPVQNPW